jgi:hypothetical protein
MKTTYSTFPLSKIKQRLGTGPPGKIINITSISGILNTPMRGSY